MTHCSSCLRAEDIVEALPDPADVPALRAKAKRAKSPKLLADSHWGNSKIGSYATSETPEGIEVTWRTIDGLERSALFEALGIDPSLENERLELGWMIANMLRVEAVRMLGSIPGPNEAMAEANRFYREEARWRFWALRGSEPAPKRQSAKKMCV